MGFSSGNDLIRTVTKFTGTHTLTSAQSGHTIVLWDNGDNSVTTITLPAAATNKGVWFLFSFADYHGATNAAHIIKSTANDMYGKIWSHNNDLSDPTITVTAATGAAGTHGKITLTNNCSAGDYIEMTSDGSSWVVEGSLNDAPTLVAYNA